MRTAPAEPLDRILLPGCLYYSKLKTMCARCEFEAEIPITTRLKCLQQASHTKLTLALTAMVNAYVYYTCLTNNNPDVLN